MTAELTTTPVPNDPPQPLTAAEELFCDLYVNGGPEFAGRAIKCYREAFGPVDSRKGGSAVQYLLSRPHIAARIREMLSSERFALETMAVKLQVSETLRTVMEETSRAEYVDRFGTPASPAPLRAVAVNAAKALMEIYPIKHAQESRLRIENGDGNVIFNVIVPPIPAANAPEENR